MGIPTAWMHIEEGCTGEEYLADYQRFWSRSSEDLGRRATKIHSFSSVSMDETISHDLSNGGISDRCVVS